jgi:hypothetical protein
MKEATEYVGKKRRFYRLNLTPPTVNTRVSLMSLVTHPISQRRLDISPISTLIISENIAAPSSLDYMGVFCLYVDIIQKYVIFNTQNIKTSDGK